MDMRRHQSVGYGWAGFLLGLSVLLSGCGDALELMNVNFQNQKQNQNQAAGQAKPGGQQSKELNRPLLRELRKYVEDANDFGELGADKDDLLERLDAADKVLTRIQNENKIALANANRRAPSLPAARMPNILMIVAPRLGVGDLGNSGQTKIPTPNLDRLADKGVVMTDFYAGGPTAVASQWTLQTGWNTARADDDFRIKDRTITLAETLWRGGYHTAFYGMWYAPDNATEDDIPLAHGYDEWMGQLYAKDAQTAYPKSLWVNQELVKLPKENDKEPVPVGDLIVRAAIKELEERQTLPVKPRPFFMMVILPPYLEMAAEFAEKELSQDTDWPAAAQSYGAAVRMTDRDVGRILAAVDRLGLEKSTSVFFTALTGADPIHAKAHKYFQSTGKFRTHKTQLGEGNLRVPFLGAFPGVILTGKRVSQPAAVWDMLPTFAELTLTQLFRIQLDGVSFASLLKTERTLPPHLLYWQTKAGKAQAVRLGSWKGLRPAGSKTLFLYDLNADPAESQDIAKENPDIVRLLIVPAK